MKFRSLVLLGSLMAATSAWAQSDLLIFDDALSNQFQDWSWAVRDFANTSPVHSGTKSISASATAWQGISFYHPPFDSSAYANFTFWANGGSAGGQRIQVYAESVTNTGPAFVIPGTLTANTWQKFVVPLSVLSVASKPDFKRVTIQLRNDGASGTFFLDDLQLSANPAPALVHLNIDATKTLQVVDERHFGVNLAMWDSYYDPPNHTTTTALLQEMATRTVRLPGGSLSDEYHWASNTTSSNTWQWAASFADMVRVATNAGVQASIVVNYGTGTPQEAAAWVRHANVTNHLGYKYWEIGNECYGTWETDTNSAPHDAFTYAIRAAAYLTQMRAADPTIKIGVVSAPGEDAYVNGNTTHAAFNARTGQSHYGWTPVMLATLKSLGAKPDFLIHHVYPEWTDQNNPSQSQDNDLTLLASTGNWAVDAAELRQEISDYFGPDGTNIELVVTENNSDAGAQGRQSTSLVNGLYYADSLSELLKTEFKGFIWWDLRNGTDQNGFFGPSIYGWRNYGDLGMINGLSTRHPTFYAAKLMQWFIQPGDRILGVSSDYPFLATCAARRANGAVTMLVINKSLNTNLMGQVALDGFTPAAGAVVHSYGIPQDEAARTNASLALQDIAMTTISNAAPVFTYNFPQLSMTVLTLTPVAPTLTRIPIADDNQFVFQLHGQPDVPYVIQSSADLVHWSPVVTNALSGSMLTMTNSISSADARFWRALWQP